MIARCCLPCPQSSGRSRCRLFGGVVRAEIFLPAVLVTGASAVAAAQLAPIASCADDSSPDSVRVISPLGSSFFCWLRGLRLRLLLQFWLRLLEPVGDSLSLLLSGRLADLLDEWVLACCASTSDLSVTSSNLCVVGVSPCGGVQIGGLTAFHPVRCLSGLFLSDQSCSPYVRVGSLVGDCHYFAAAWEGYMLAGHELHQASEF